MTEGAVKNTKLQPAPIDNCPVYNMTSLLTNMTSSVLNMTSDMYSEGTTTWATTTEYYPKQLPEPYVKGLCF